MNILEFSQVTWRCKDFAIENVSFTLPAGYIMGLIGKNGAGKTTLFRLLANQYKKYEGGIMATGYNCKTEADKVKDCTAFLSEEQPFFMDMTVLSNAEYYAPYYSTWDQEAYLYYLEQFRIPMLTPIKTFSKGEFMKFQLAFGIAHHPKLYAMDEPTAGLDPVFRREFLCIMQEIVQKEEASILFSTHITSDLDKIVDYITMLENGKVLFSKDKETLLDEWNAGMHKEMRLKDLF